MNFNDRERVNWMARLMLLSRKTEVPIVETEVFNDLGHSFLFPCFSLSNPFYGTP